MHICVYISIQCYIAIETNLHYLDIAESVV